MEWAYAQSFLAGGLSTIIFDYYLVDLVCPLFYRFSLIRIDILIIISYCAGLHAEYSIFLYPDYAKIPTAPLHNSIHDSGVELPNFGSSPGPTPQSTRPPTPESEAISEVL